MVNRLTDQVTYTSVMSLSVRGAVMPLVCYLRNDLSSVLFKCGLKNILVPQARLRPANFVFSLSKSTAKQRKIVLKSNIIIALRGKLNSLSPRFGNFKLSLFAGGLIVNRFRSASQCKGSTVLCEGSDKLLKTVKPHSYSDKFILLRWISNLISFIRIILRAIRLFITFSPLLFVYPFTIPSKTLRGWWWALMFRAVEFSGPAFIKLGQWASTRRDLFSEEFCDRFCKLHHHVKAHSWRHTQKILRKAYGRMWKEVLLFDNDAKPIGSGCVAQVYKAYVREEKLADVELEQIQEDINEQEAAFDILAEHKTFEEGVAIEPLEPLEVFKSKSKKKDSPGDAAPLDLVMEPGRKATNFDPDSLIQVAIKVLHPGVQDTFARDLTLMSAMARGIQFVFPSLRWLSLTECVAEFSTIMKKQMNMKHEARCLEKLLKDFTQNQNVKIPVPLWPLVTRDVLVETFEEGEPVSNFIREGDEDTNNLRRRLAEMGIQALLEMVFVNNFVHADLHPGNILVQNAADFKEEVEDQLVLVNVGDCVVTGVTKADNPVKLVFLDGGITASLSESDRVKFREVFTAVVKGEGEAVAELFLTRTEHVECKDPEAFKRDMAAVVMKARGETLSLSQIHVAELMSEVFRVLRTHHVKLESNFSTVILAMAVLEGLGRSLDSELDILEKARPVLIDQMLFS